MLRFLNLFRKSGHNTGDDEADGGWPHIPRSFVDTTITQLPTLTARAGILGSQGAAGIDPNPYGSSGAGGNALNLHTHSDRTEG